MTRLRSPIFSLEITILSLGLVLLAIDGQAAESRVSSAPAVCQAIVQVANSGGLLSRLTLPTSLTPDAPKSLSGQEAVQIRLDIDADGRIDTVYAGSEYISIRGPSDEDHRVTRDPEVDWDRDRFRWSGLLGAFAYRGKQYLVWGGTHTPAFASAISGKRVERVECEFAQQAPANRRLTKGDASVCAIALANSFSYAPFDRSHSVPLLGKIADSTVGVSERSAVVDIDNDGATEEIVRQTFYAPNSHVCDSDSLAILNESRDGLVDTETVRLLADLAEGCGSILKPFSFDGDQYLEKQWLRRTPLRADAVFKIEAGSVRQLCELEHVPVSIALSEYERFLDAAKEYGNEPWSFAMQRKDTLGLELLVRNGRDVNEIIGPDRGDTTPLLLAIRNQQLIHVDWLLLHGANPDLGAGYATVPLREAIRFQSHSIGRRLLEAGASHEIPGYELQALAGETSASGQDLAIDLIKRIGSIPDSVARVSVARNPDLADALLDLKLPVALDGIEWNSGELQQTPLHLARSLQAQPVLLEKIDRLFSRTVRTPGDGATAQYLNGEQGWIISRGVGSSLTDHEFLMMSTSLCTYFFDAICGPSSLVTEALAWEQGNLKPCWDQAIAQEMGPAACGAIAAYNSRVSEKASNIRGIFTITSTVTWENHLATFQEFREFRRAKTVRAGKTP